MSFTSTLLPILAQHIQIGIPMLSCGNFYSSILDSIIFSPSSSMHLQRCVEFLCVDFASIITFIKLIQDLVITIPCLYVWIVSLAIICFSCHHKHPCWHAGHPQFPLCWSCRWGRTATRFSYSLVIQPGLPAAAEIFKCRIARWMLPLLSS